MKYIACIISFFLFFSCVTQNPPSPPLSSISGNIQDTKKILALGDSLTAGYGIEEVSNYPSQLQNILQKNGYNYEVINAGVSGDTSEDLLERADLYLDKNPDIVIIVIGGNDGLRGLSTLQMKGNIQKILDIYEPGSAKIVLGGMDIPANIGLEYRSEFKQVYQDVARENPDLYFLPFFLEEVAGNTSLNIADKIHPNKAGYSLIVKNLNNYLERENIIKK